MKEYFRYRWYSVHRSVDHKIIGTVHANCLDELEEKNRLFVINNLENHGYSMLYEDTYQTDKMMKECHEKGAELEYING